jgi:Asp-tRNA(Asn)/Glu-tRNA(Gln) amidotransferase A subunit family amidase
MPEIAALSASEIAGRIAAGEVRAEAVAEAHLARIRAHESEVGAFAHIDPELVRAQARAIDAGRRGPLAGVPLAVKDLFDTVDQPTGYGSPIYRGHRPGRDAASVALARAAGAIIIGKTVTTEFAHQTPGKTANPLALTRTPGGSSSGSAAAVAAFMAPLALGTQTGGSVIRPASFCGVVGYKPSWSRISTAGVKPLSETFDHVGTFARSVLDTALLAEVLAGDSPSRLEPVRPARVALVRTPFWRQADPAVGDALETALAVLGKGRVRRVEIDEAVIFAGIEEASETMMPFEGARLFAHERTAHKGELSARFRDWLVRADGIQRAAYEAMRGKVEGARVALEAAFEHTDLLLTPAAPGEAPEGLAATGDAMFNKLWTLLHAPCMTLPFATGRAGLPIGVQLVGRRWSDRKLFAYASWVEATLSPHAAPGARARF